MPVLSNEVIVVARLFCQLAIVVIVLLGGSSIGAENVRPNIIVIVVDDLRWDELSCTGNPIVRTPHIDRIANEGVRFRNAFAVTPLCSPSRGSLLTGLYPHQHGIIDNTNRSERSHQLATFPKWLHDREYRTGFIGKWHMGNDDSARPGFDDWAGLAGQGTSVDPVVNVNGKRVEHRGYTTDVLNEFAARFVRADVSAGGAKKPFCLYLAHKALHPELVQFDDGRISDPNAAKFIAAPRHEHLYDQTPIPRRLNTTDILKGKPALQRTIAGLPPLGRETGTSDDEIRDRWRMLAAVDEGVGQLLKVLAESNQLDNTVIVFTSDHGYWYGEHGLSVERRLAYEEGIRIPLLIRYPSRIPAGTLVDELVLTLDLAPTMLSLANAPPPAGLSGRDIMPLLSPERPVAWRTSFLIEHHTDNVFPRTANMAYQAIRTERYKYIHYTELEGMDELYDLLQDPYEMHNVISSPDRSPTLMELKKELERQVGT